jgi:hypothetical protein
MDDFPEWGRGDDGNLVIGEIVLQLLSRHEHGVQELLHLRVAGLGLGEYLADKLHQSLNLQHLTRLLPFDYESDTEQVRVGAVRMAQERQELEAEVSNTLRLSKAC